MVVEIKVPSVGESVSEVTLGRWLKKEGDFVKTDEVICEIESEKATLEIPSSQNGRIKILVEEGDNVAIGSVIAEIDTQAGNISETDLSERNDRSENSAAKSEPTTQKIPEEKPRKISPVAAKMLDEAGVSMDEIKSSGDGGRIKKEDVKDVIAASHKLAFDRSDKSGVGAQNTGSEPGMAKVSPAQLSSRSSKERTERRKKISTLRKTIAQRLVLAKNETAMLTTFNEINMKPIMEARNRYRDLFIDKYEIKLGFMSFFIKACALALQENPIVNARLEAEEIVFHDYVDISVAVSTDKGLVVPVIFDADRLSLAQIETEVANLAQKARLNKLTIEEMTGGTFSITNGGVFGSLLSTPLLNTPQSAILGMHKIEDRPIALNGQIAILPMMYVAMSYDHRIIDGRESVSFLARVKELVEDPLRMLLEV